MFSACCFHCFWSTFYYVYNNINLLNSK